MLAMTDLSGHPAHVEGVTSPAARLPALTVALKDKLNPVRIFIDRRFGRTAELQRQYRDAVGELVVDGTGDASTVGGAFDWIVRFLLHPNPSLKLAVRGALLVPPLKPALVDVARLLGYRRGEDGKVAFVEHFDGPVSGCEVPPQLLARASWALALMTDLYRVGPLPGSPLTQLNVRYASVQQLLELAPAHAIDQLLRLREHAAAVLLPALASRPGRWSLGPTFVGSQFMNADADVVAAGLLLELKTNLGDKRAKGIRRATLEGQTIQQILGYALLDLIDEFKITHVGLYNARYAHLAQWPLQDFLDELAGRHVDFEEERDSFRRLLQRNAGAGPWTPRRSVGQVR